MYMVIQKNMEKHRARCVETRFENGQDDIIHLPFFTKEIISGREREKIQSTRVHFPSFEHIRNTDGKELRLGFLRDFCLLIYGKDLLNMKCGDHPKDVEATDIVIGEKRKLMYKLAEKTDTIQLNVLKAHMLNIMMVEEDLNNIHDVWECLKFLENNLTDEELFPLLKIVYKKDAQLQKLLNDFTNGATGVLKDKFPIQEVGDQDQTFQSPHTDWRRESQLLSYDPRFSDSFSMIPDGFKMGSTKPEPSKPLAMVYDRGKHPGLCIIFNNKTFVNEITHPTRQGTDEDRDVLEETLKKYGYEVIVYNDQSRSEMLQKLEEYQSRCYSDYGALIVLTLSHGEQDVVFGSCGHPIAISSITSLFRADNCPSLAGKPKIFIYQACQGRVPQKVWHRTHDSIQVYGDTLWMCEKPEMTSKFPDADQLPLGPADADFLIVHSTMPGFVSLRNENGSFFIQSLVRKIEEHSEREDFVSILTEVNRDVSQKIGVISDDQLACQIPESKTRLTKKFYLQPVE